VEQSTKKEGEKMISAFFKAGIFIYLAFIIGIVAGYGWAYYHYFIGG